MMLGGTRSETGTGMECNEKCSDTSEKCSETSCFLVEDLSEGVVAV
jgi:hypothetical protein